MISKDDILNAIQSLIAERDALAAELAELKSNGESATPPLPKDPVLTYVGDGTLVLFQSEPLAEFTIDWFANGLYCGSSSSVEYTATSPGTYRARLKPLAGGPDIESNECVVPMPSQD